MKRIVIALGVILVLAGAVCLSHPNFSYQTHEEVAKIGPFQATVMQDKVVQVPLAASAAAIVIGLALVLLGPRMKP
jgi:uncharacterized membrane protein